MITTPAEYRVLRPSTHDRLTMIGYAFCALRRELDWHRAAAHHIEGEHNRRAATVAAFEITDAVERMLKSWHTPEDACYIAEENLRRDTIDGYAVDAQQIEYRTDAANRLAEIGAALVAMDA